MRIWRNHAISIMLCALLVGCFSAKHYQGEINLTIDRIGKYFVPDHRLGIWDIRPEIKKNRVKLLGETTSPEGVDSLKQELEKSFSNISFEYSVDLLPLSDLENTHAIVRVNVGHIRRKPDVSSEMITQALMGAPLNILKQDKWYYFVQMEDGYLGWISKESVTECDELSLNNWFDENLGVYVKINGRIYEKPDYESFPVSDIVLGARIKMIELKNNWVRVMLPDGRKGYIPGKELIPVSDFEKIRPSENGLIDLALRLKGISYTWGGTTTYGLDCSGFTQTIFRMNGIQLMRDANMQVTQGVEVDTSGNFRNLKAGDLLFFGSSPDRITHVGMYLGDFKFIHSSGMVKINSLNPKDPDFSSYRAKSLRRVKRMF